jgi:4-amino-4-deoxy-L-arabinose transferase-like glycosyltransferase
MISLFGWGTTRLVRNFYEASFMLPLLMIAVLLAVSAATGSRWLRLAGAAVAAVIGAAALLSLPLTVATWKDSLLRSWQEEGYIREQVHSVAFRHFNHTRRDIGATAELCHIPPPEKAHGLMLDDLSYFPYMTSHLPQHQLGVVGLWKGSIADPVAYLRSRGSDGMLVSCVLLSPELLRRAHRHGEFCCLAPPDW